MDLILGRFADAEIADLTDAELDELERLIELPDPDLYAALTGDSAACAGICRARCLLGSSRFGVADRDA